MTTIMLVVLLVVSATSQAAVMAPVEVPRNSAEIDSHGHLHDDSHVLSWTIHGQSHDASDHDHGYEMLGQQLIVNPPLSALADPATARHPVYCAPVLDVESPPRV